MPLPLRLLLAALIVASGGCRSDLPETPYSASTSCIELRFGGARAAGKKITLGQVVSRALDPEDCGSLATVRTQLFSDLNGNGTCDEGEERSVLEDPPKEFMRSIHISERKVAVEGDLSSLHFLVEVRTTSGEVASVLGPVENS